METLILLALVVAAAVVVGLRRNRRLRSTTVEVVADADGVRRRLVDGRVESVSWPEVVEIEVFTTRVGPHRSSGGAVVLFGDDERGCIVPLDRLADSGLLDHAHRLPGFDPAELVAALGTPTEATNPRSLLAPRPLSQTTVCWRREET